jgi:hypothetical protein
MRVKAVLEQSIKVRNKRVIHVHAADLCRQHRKGIGYTGSYTSSIRIRG